MAHYRKIQVGVNNDRKFRRLSDDAKLAWFFTQTHPAVTAVGAMRASVPGLAAEMGWQERKFRAALEELVAAEMLQLDEESSFLWFPKFTRHNLPETPNVAKGWVKAIDLVPECDMRTATARNCAATLGAVEWTRASERGSCDLPFLQAFVEMARRMFGDLYEAEIQEGFMEGLPEGLAEGLSKALTEGLPEGLPEGFGEGFAEAFMKGFDKALLKGFAEGLRKIFLQPYINQKQKQKQQQKQKQENTNQSTAISTGGEKPGMVASSEDLQIIRGVLEQLPVEHTLMACRRVVEKSRAGGHVPIDAICTELRKTGARIPANVQNPTGWLIAEMEKTFALTAGAVMRADPPAWETRV